MAWANIRRVRQKQAKSLEAGAPKWADPKLAARVLEMLSNEKEPARDFELDVHAATLTGSKYWFEYAKTDKSRWPDWMERWADDLAFATRALFACTTLSAEHDDDEIVLRACEAAEGL